MTYELGLLALVAWTAIIIVLVLYSARLRSDVATLLMERDVLRASLDASANACGALRQECNSLHAQLITQAYVQRGDDKLARQQPGAEQIRQRLADDGVAPIAPADSGSTRWKDLWADVRSTDSWGKT